MKFTCPAHHCSETAEFCSVCGLEISGTALPAEPSAGAVALRSAAAVAHTGMPPESGAARCPDCGAPRDNLPPEAGGRQVFCEVCGYNFATHTAGAGPPPSCLPPVAGSGPAEPAKPVDQPQAGSENHAANDAARWELVVTVDAHLYGTENPDAPAGQLPRMFRLFQRESIIGRAAPELRVSVPVCGDPGVSRRHALLIDGPDGPLLLRDLNSANGTQIDGRDVVPGVDTPLHDGAVIAMGAWTSILVRAMGTGAESAGPDSRPEA